MLMRSYLNTHSTRAAAAGKTAITFAAAPASRWILCAALAIGIAFGWSGEGHAQSARKPISKEAPVFPSEALDEGIDSGTVKVRIAVAGDGSVSGVEILDAQPKRIFDKSVTRAVMRWRYEPNGVAETIDAQLTFKSR